LLIAYPMYVWLMSFVLRRCGVPQKEIAKWALRQADRQRFADLIRAARGLPVLPVDAESP
jgi:CRISPR/Cas system-associated protein Cas7 (RAMP superfamily)